MLEISASFVKKRDVVLLSVITYQLNTMEEDPGSSAGIPATQTVMKTEEPKTDVDSTEAQIKLVEDFTEGFLSAFLPEVGNLQERLSELTYVAQKIAFDILANVEVEWNIDFMFITTTTTTSL